MTSTHVTRVETFLGAVTANRAVCSCGWKTEYYRAKFMALGGAISHEECPETPYEKLPDNSPLHGTVFGKRITSV